jgi:hypothetical protein
VPRIDADIVRERLIGWPVGMGITTVAAGEIQSVGKPVGQSGAELHWTGSSTLPRLHQFPNLGPVQTGPFPHILPTFDYLGDLAMETESLKRISVQVPAAVIGDSPVNEGAVTWRFRAVNEYLPVAMVVELIARVAGGDETTIASTLASLDVECRVYGTESWAELSVTSGRELRGRWPGAVRGDDVKVFARVSAVEAEQGTTSLSTLAVATLMSEPPRRTSYTATSESIVLSVL